MKRNPFRIPHAALRKRRESRGEPRLEGQGS